jgi:hypothetical protein
LVTFYTKHSFLAIDDAWLTAINKTPYDGIAVMLTGAYSTDLITATLENKINAKIKVFGHGYFLTVLLEENKIDVSI